MKVITVRELIRGVAARWAEQYKREPADGPRTAVAWKLRELDAETSTEADVEAIIGNRSWTSLYCDECGYDAGPKDAVVELGEEPDHERRTVTICASCIVKAFELIR